MLQSFYWLIDRIFVPFQTKTQPDKAISEIHEMTKQLGNSDALLPGWIEEVQLVARGKHMYIYLVPCLL